MVDGMTTPLIDAIVGDIMAKGYPSVYYVMPGMITKLTEESDKAFRSGMGFSSPRYMHGNRLLIVSIAGARLVEYNPIAASREIKEQELMYGLEPL